MVCNVNHLKRQKNYRILILIDKIMKRKLCKSVDASPFSSIELPLEFHSGCQRGKKIYIPQKIHRG